MASSLWHPNPLTNYLNVDARKHWWAPNFFTELSICCNMFHVCYKVYPWKRNLTCRKSRSNCREVFTPTLLEKHPLSLSVGSGPLGLREPVSARTFTKGSSGGPAYCSNNHVHSFQATHCWQCQWWLELYPQIWLPDTAVANVAGQPQSLSATSSSSTSRQIKTN